MSKLEVEISGDVKKLKTAINDATGQLKGLANQGAKTSNKVSSNFKLAGRSAGQAGIQIQQFVGQIQGGQNPLVAFSQQAADLGFVMGVPLAGAIASIGAALVSFLIPSLTKSKNEAKGLNEEFKSQSKILKELIKNYGQFDKIRITSRFNTIKEREELKALNLNVLDYTQSEETRIRALKQLIKLYPRYFKGLDISQTNALIKAEGAVNKVLLRKQKLKQTLIKLEEATQKLENNSIELNEKRGSFNIKDVERVKVLDSQNLKLRDQIKLLREALELFVSYDTSFKELQNQKPIVVPITIGQPAGLTSLDAGGLTGYLGFTLAESIGKSIEAAKLRMQLALEDFNMAADQIIRNNIANTFAGIGEAIGNAMTGAANLGQGLAKVLLSSVGSLLVQLGKLAISVGVGLAKIKKALQSLNPKLAIAAGVGLIAVGSAFKAGAAKIGGSMGTGSVAGAGSSSGFSSGTTFGGARPFSGNLTFTIRGTDLVAVYNLANAQNAIIGGNVSVG